MIESETEMLDHVGCSVDDQLLTQLLARAGDMKLLSAVPSPAPGWNEAGAELSIDEVAVVFGFLTHFDIMRARVCSTWREAAKKTLVPQPQNKLLAVNSVRSYNAMRVMSTALPNIQQISIRPLGPDQGQRYINGEDPGEMKPWVRDGSHLRLVEPDEWAAVTASWVWHDINIVSNFRMLRELSIQKAPLNGKYPIFFNFPLLRVLRIHYCNYLKWDLEMLEGLPLLEELDCIGNPYLTGTVNSLRVVRDTLVKVKIVASRSVHWDSHYEYVTGNFMDLADFPRLKVLDLKGTKMTGDIRDIGRSDFPALEDLNLPHTVIGGVHYQITLVSEVPSFMQTIHLLMQRNSMMFHEMQLSGAFGWKLGEGSPDWYAPHNDQNDDGSGSPWPPFSLRIVQIGNRFGWSWTTAWYGPSYQPCELNWLDPEPSRESDDYKAYMVEMQDVQKDIDIYSGYYEQPPNEQQYRRLCDEWEHRG